MDLKNCRNSGTVEENEISSNPKRWNAKNSSRSRYSRVRITYVE